MRIFEYKIKVTREGKGKRSDKKIFKSTMLVCFVVLVTGLLFVMGILYGNFGGQLQRELTERSCVSGVWGRAAGSGISAECF
ncbi:MAG: hypothetical protein ACLUTA_16415 [Blautia wexlerae]